MIRVSAPSRLHFGLLNTGHLTGVPRFGGCGLMIEAPGVSVGVEPAPQWSATGPNAERALALAQRVTTVCHRVVVERCPPEHVGLGVGTSLGLSVARALRPDAPIEELARLTGRGLRSGVGLYGFAHGGIICDAGRDSTAELPRCGDRLAFPPDWRIVLIRPPVQPAWFGAAERQAFAESGVADPWRLYQQLRDALAQIRAALEGDADFPAFAEAVFTFNREGGRWFESAQGGVYAAPAIAAIIDRVRQLGFVGVGQSSWGPTVFACTADAEQAEFLARHLQKDSSELSIATTAAAPHGASVTRL
ncbi:MAG: hypothetical protein LC104_00610 [Bacteroidales bacterium]|nr:hypothetical protein [Bacteroidales bacterium]